MKLTGTTKICLVVIVAVCITILTVEWLGGRAAGKKYEEMVRDFEIQKKEWERERGRMMDEIEKGRAVIREKEKEIQQKQKEIVEIEEGIEKSKAESKTLAEKIEKLKTEVEDVLRENPKVAELVGDYEEQIASYGAREVAYQGEIRRLREIDEARSELVAKWSGEAMLWKQAYEREKMMREISEDMRKELEKQKRGDKIWVNVGKGAVLGVVGVGLIKAIGTVL